jgi:hypothetical protein
VKGVLTMGQPIDANGTQAAPDRRSGRPFSGSSIASSWPRYEAMPQARKPATLPHLNSRKLLRSSVSQVTPNTESRRFQRYPRSSRMRREAHVRFLGGRPPRGGPLPAKKKNRIASPDNCDCPQWGIVYSCDLIAQLSRSGRTIGQTPQPCHRSLGARTGKTSPGRKMFHMRGSRLNSPCPLPA